MCHRNKKSFWVPYAERETYPTASRAHMAIAQYCQENGYTYDFPGEDEAIIDGESYNIFRGYQDEEQSEYGVKCQQR